MSDKNQIRIKYLFNFGKLPDLNNPTTFNEKLQWLKLYNRNPLYTVMVDKFQVRKYISDKIGDDYLIPLLGSWEKPEEIDFESLPSKFILKCNHNSGTGMLICSDKNKINIEKVKDELQKGINEDYYIYSREWPYKNVPRKIICEEFMKDYENDYLINYKFYCFNGKAKFIQVSSGLEDKQTSRLGYYDLDFNTLDFYREDYK